MKFELSQESRHTMQSPIAKVAVSLVGIAAIVLAYQIFHHILFG